MGSPTPNVPARVIDHEITALMSETRRGGPWTPGTTTLVKATLAQVDLDLREAVVAEREVCLDVEVLIGSIVVTIPPTWAVIQEVDIFVGSCEEDKETHEGTPEHVLRIVGRIRVGSVEIRRRMPGEGWLGAKKRRWRLRKSSQKALPPGG